MRRCRRDAAGQAGDRHRRLALAEELVEARPEQAERLLQVGDVHRPAAVGDRLQIGEVGAGDLRGVHEPGQHRRRGEERDARMVRGSGRGSRPRRNAAGRSGGRLAAGTAARRGRRRATPARRADACRARRACRCRRSSTGWRRAGCGGSASRPSAARWCRRYRTARPGRSAVPARDVAARRRAAASYSAVRVEMMSSSVSTVPASGASASARPGVATSSCAPELSAMYSTSRGWSRALAGTAHSPAAQQPNSSSKNSPQFSRLSSTRSPGARPRARNAPPMRATRSISSR